MENAIPPGRAKRLAFSMVGLVALVAGLAFWIRFQLVRLVEERVASGLQVTLDAAAEGTAQLLEGARRSAQAAIDDPRASTAALDCMRAGECAAAVPLLLPYLRAGGFTGLQLIGSRGELLAAAPTARPPAAPDRALLERIAQLPLGRAAVLLPSPELGAKLHAVVALADPSAGRAGAVIFELPMSGVNHVLRAARAGQSGETYAFDRQGRMLSESRFAAELARMGLSPHGDHGGPGFIELRDPGHDLRTDPHLSGERGSLPPTHMAARALAGKGGVELHPYRDYRGVMVVGAWTFLSEFDLGIATEVDAREVFGTLVELKRLFSWLIAALAIVSTALLAAVAYAAFLQQRLARKTPHLRALD